jgi:hypothetical protein
LARNQNNVYKYRYNRCSTSPSQMDWWFFFNVTEYWASLVFECLLSLSALSQLFDRGKPKQP